VWSLQTQQIPAVRSRATLPKGGRGVCPDLPLVGSLLPESGRFSVQRVAAILFFDLLLSS